MIFCQQPANTNDASASVGAMVPAMEKLPAVDTRGTVAVVAPSGRLGYEGGQTPVLFRFPNRGFSNVNFRTDYQVINVDVLNEVFEDGAEVNAAALAEKGMIDADGGMVKILGDGEMTKKLTVEADKFSKSAAEKINAAGGEAKVIEKKSAKQKAWAKRMTAKRALKAAIEAKKSATQE